MFAYTQSYGFTVYALLLFYDPKLFGGDKVCVSSIKMAAFGCVPFAPDGQFIGKFIVITTAVIKSLAIITSFIYKPHAWIYLHDRITEYRYYKAIKLVIILFLWSTAIVQTERLLICNGVEIGELTEWSYGQVSLRNFVQILTFKQIILDSATRPLN